MIIGMLIFCIGGMAGLLLGLLMGGCTEEYFKYKTRLAELKAQEEERIEEYIKKQREGANEKTTRFRNATKDCSC